TLEPDAGIERVSTPLTKLLTLAPVTPPAVLFVEMTEKLPVLITPKLSVSTPLTVVAPPARFAPAGLFIVRPLNVTGPVIVCADEPLNVKVLVPALNVALAPLVKLPWTE